MKHDKPLAWMMAIAIASTMTTACSLDGNEPEKPFVTCPAHDASLYACGISESDTRSASDKQDILFTQRDIEWFNVNTREIKFRDMDEPLYKRLQPTVKSSSVWATMTCLWSAVLLVTGTAGYTQISSCIMMRFLIQTKAKAIIICVTAILHSSLTLTR